MRQAFFLIQGILVQQLRGRENAFLRSEHSKLKRGSFESAQAPRSG
jgi:hypothetical protein